MSQFWQPGSVALYLGPQNCQPAAARFIGFGVMTPETEFRPLYKPIYSDMGGTMMKSERGFGGEEAFVAVDFSWYSQQAIDIIANLLNSAADFAAPAAAASTRGLYNFGSVGTLMQTEGYLLTLFLLNTNMTAAGSPAVFPAQPLGYRFPCAACVQNTLPRKSLEENQLARMAFECDNLFGIANGVPNWMLYDENVVGLPNAA